MIVTKGEAPIWWKNEKKNPNYSQIQIKNLENPSIAPTIGGETKGAEMKEKLKKRKKRNAKEKERRKEKKKKKIKKWEFGLKMADLNGKPSKQT